IRRFEDTKFKEIDSTTWRVDFFCASVECVHNSLRCFCIRANERLSRSRRQQCYVKLTSCPSCGLTINSIRYCPYSNCNLL
ncbi:hypothetical protein L9F63_008010, partial [Diploptera punctata]